MFPDTEKSPSMTMEEALGAAKGFLEAHYADKKMLWDVSTSRVWENMSASPKQIQILKKKLSEDEQKRIGIDHLTKREASNILTFLLQK